MAGRLNNDMNEQFARHRARGMNASKAALAAGYAPGSSTTHLDRDADIIARIKELQVEFLSNRDQQRAAAKEAARMVGQLTGVGRSWVVAQLAENALNAAREGEYRDSNHALELIGKEFGMFEGKQAGDEDEGSAIPQLTNMDALEGLLDAAQAALPQVPALPALYGEDDALALIEGQQRAARSRRADWVTPAERVLSTGSETDLALFDLDAIDAVLDGADET